LGVEGETQLLKPTPAAQSAANFAAVRTSPACCIFTTPPDNTASGCTIACACAPLTTAIQKPIVASIFFI
jgi:hypothetical protein